jgi:uncharacterized phage protein gp47/JayE
MTFTPRLPPDIMSQMLARVLASNDAGLTDVSEGGVLATILGSIAQELSNIESRIYLLDQSFFLNASGVDLDRRVAEFPTSFARRLPASAASGGRFTLRRTMNSVELRIQPRRLIVSSSYKQGVTYTNQNEIVFEANSDIPNVPEQAFISTSLGENTNLDLVGAIDTIVSGSSELISCTNTVPISGGSDQEDDTSLRIRAQRWMASLALCQNNALETLALSYTATNGTRVNIARMWNDPDMPGYSELMVDDGTGMQGVISPASSASGTIPALQGEGNRHTVYFNYPAATSPVITVGGVELPYNEVSVQLEKGVAYIVPNPTSVTITPGMTWTTGGHQVYTGVLADLQAVINDTAVAAGTRVRVVPPDVQLIAISGNLTVITGSDIRAVRQEVRDEIQNFISQLAPGEPLLIYNLIGFLSDIEGVLNIVFDQTDIYPGSVRTKLYATDGTITLR